jgi:hypothetical protein
LAISKLGELRALCLLSALWIAAALIVNPNGDFPVVDDWAYAQSVQALLQDGRFFLSDWTAANLASQVLWGAGFASIFGFSMTVLRWSTLVLGLVGGIAIFRLFRLAGVTQSVALLGALTSIFNPLYFILAFSFMSDVPYAAMQLAAMWLIAEGAMANGPARQGLGWLIAVAALLCRQIGVVIPIAFAAETALRGPWRWRRVLLALAGVAAFVLLQWAYVAWLEASGHLPLLFGRQVNSIGATLIDAPLDLISLALDFATQCFFYLGLVALPFTVACIPGWSRSLRPPWRIGAYAVVLILSVAIFAHQVVSEHYFPTWKDTFNSYNGLGAGTWTATPLSHMAKLILTALASFGGVLLLAALAGAVTAWRRGDPSARFNVARFALFMALCMLGVTALVALRFDRYLIPVLPCLLIALSVLFLRSPAPRLALASGFITVALMGFVSIGATHDYLAYQRVHWEAYTRLSRCVPIERIDAGWVANGASNFGRYGDPRNYRTWFAYPTYLVGSGLETDYAVIETHTIERWLPWNQSAPPLRIQEIQVEHPTRAYSDLLHGRRLQRCLLTGTAEPADPAPIRSRQTSPLSPSERTSP